MQPTAAIIAAILVGAITWSAARADWSGGSSSPAAPVWVSQARPAVAQPSPTRPRPAQVMALTGPWPDGGVIPPEFTQAGDELSPALAWSGTPEGTTHFVLIVHDLDAVTSLGTDDVLHWLVWNIPAGTTSLPEGVGHGPTLADGARQISVSGPYYRGPGAAAAGPAHHYAFELFAVDVPIAVPPSALSPAETRAAVLAGMAGHVRGKAVYTGRFKRGL